MRPRRSSRRRASLPARVSTRSPSRSWSPGSRTRPVSIPSRFPRTQRSPPRSATSCGPTKMSPREIFALRDHLGAELTGRTLSDAHDVVSLTDILKQTVLGGRLRELSGRAVLLKLSDQLRSGLAMIELDGVARRMLLCPPDLNPAYLDALIADAGIDAVVTDEPDRSAETGVPLVVTAQLPPQATTPARTERATEWLMLTSGTS